MKKNKRKLSWQEKSAISDIIWNVLIMVVWLVDFVFICLQANVQACLAVMMVILLFGERLFRAIDKYQKAKEEALKAEKEPNTDSGFTWES